MFMMVVSTQQTAFINQVS